MDLLIRDSLMEKFNSNEFCYHVFALLNVGITLREALQRQIDYCNLSPNDPILFQYGDPYKRPIPWDSEISQIGSGSAKLTLGVELEDNSKRPKSHDFVWTEFTIGFDLRPLTCNKCRRHLFSMSIKSLTGFTDFK